MCIIAFIDGKYAVLLKNLCFIFIEGTEVWYTETYKQVIVLLRYRPIMTFCTVPPVYESSITLLHYSHANRQLLMA